MFELLAFVFDMTMDEKADENRKEVTADNVGGKRKREKPLLSSKR